MRYLLVSVLFSIAACGGSSSSDAGADLATTVCPQSIHDVDDGQSCGSVDLECNPCGTTCGACEELLCQNGQWIHMLEQIACDGGDPGT